MAVKSGQSAEPKAAQTFSFTLPIAENTMKAMPHDSE